jgi:hypothetical protein
MRRLLQARRAPTAMACGSIHDPPAIDVRADRTALRHHPGAPIGGCGPPHPASNATAAPMLNTQRRNAKLLIGDSLPEAETDRRSDVCAAQGPSARRSDYESASMRRVRTVSKSAVEKGEFPFYNVTNFITQ